MRVPRPDAATLQAARALSRAEEDYLRLRAAWVGIARDEPGNEIGLAMVGADMERAHAALQALIGVPPVPVPAPSAPARAGRLRARSRA